MDDLKKKQHDTQHSGGQSGQPHDKEFEQQHKNPDDISQKRPPQGGHDVEQDKEKGHGKDQGQRRAS